MPWPPRRTSSHELQLQRECEVLQLRILKANSELRTKTVYAQRLEYLVHERSERVDELNAKLEQSRAHIKRLDEECEHLGGHDPHPAAARGDAQSEVGCLAMWFASQEGTKDH